jgi:phage shock protein C
MKRLYKSKINKMIFGVCGGVAEYFNVDPTIVRLIYTLLTVFTVGIPGVVAYILCGIIIPEDDGII